MQDSVHAEGGGAQVPIKAEGRSRASAAQLRYLEQGLGQPGGKLPIFDDAGQEIALSTIQSCVKHGWAEPWFDNPIKRNWIVCRLTPAGRLCSLTLTTAEPKNLG